MSSIYTPNGSALTSFVRRTLNGPKKAAFLITALAALLGCSATVGRAQSALDGFDPNANGTVRVMVVQPDGKILIGGDFTTLAPNGGPVVTRNRIARLNPDGTLDTAFDPNSNDQVFAIAVQADGKVLVAGRFSNIGGQARNRIARLDATTGLADSFNPNPNADVYRLVVQADSKILTAGIFTSIGGQGRSNIARLDAVSGLADSFNPNANGSVDAIAVQSDGKVLAGGLFTNIGGQPRNNIARLDATTGLADSFNPNANNAVDTIAIQADGKILVGGVFSGPNCIGGQERNRIARLEPTTGLADSFDPNSLGRVFSIVVQPDGKILAAGNFAGANSIGGATRNRVARLHPATGLADSFDPNPDQSVAAIAVQPDGKILLGGDFTTLAPNGGSPVTRNYIARLEIDGRLDQTLTHSIGAEPIAAIAMQADGKILIGGSIFFLPGISGNMARLNTDGTVDTGFNPNVNGFVRSIAVQADGKILIGGAFTNVGGQPRNRIARLDAATGAVDLSFDPNANNEVRTIAVQPDGQILVGGIFTSIGGQTRNRIARLNAATGLPDSFNPNANGEVYSIGVQVDGKIVVGGNFVGDNCIGGQRRDFMARLDGITGLADSFNPNPDFAVISVVVQADGKILAGGNFMNVGGQPRNRIARLDATSGLADSFNPNANGTVWALTAQADGKIIAGGTFTSIGGQPRNRLARLDGASGNADSFNPNPTDFLEAIALQGDGKLLAGGEFGSIGGQPRSAFGRLSNDTPALRNLSVTQTTINWTQGGANPQFTRVTFEYSNDNANYTFLGSGAASGSSWTLTGLNLPTGGNVYIRARGYYRSGWQSGSESINQTVRNAFLTGPPGPPTIQFSATSYSQSESGPSTDITVTRTGDTTGAASVDFRTEGNDYVPCNQFNGSAVQNCDFILSSGTLNFAAGQTSRTFPIIINDDTWMEGNETLGLTLSNPVGATLGSQSTATLTIIDNDIPGSTPSTAPKTFIATLSSSQQVPPTGTSGKGGGVVILDASETAASVGLAFSRISSGETEAHIHGPAASGVNGPIAFTLPIGTVLAHSISPTTQQVSDLKNGLQYIDVHTTGFTGGEIRGQLLWNPLNEPQYLVTQHYYDFLGRVPDQGGLDFWTNELIGCGASAQCIRDRTVAVSNAFFYEQEYQQTASYVFLLYRAAFGNDQPFPNPDPANVTEAKKLPEYLTFVRDRSQVVGGSELASSQQALAIAFVQRPEFIARYPLSLSTGAQFVGAVLGTIQASSGVDLSSQSATLINHFNTGGRGRVMFHLANDYWNGCNRLPGSPAAPCVPSGFGAAVDNRPFIDAEYNRSFVYSQYSGYLRRDSDIGGFIFWLNQVSTAPPRDASKQKGMVCAFITSAEYQFRFGDKAPRTNAECIP